MSTATPMVVVDTSVHLSALIFARAKDSPAKEVIVRGFAKHFRFGVSALLLEEIARKLVVKGFAPVDVATYIAGLELAAARFDDGDTDGIICSDPEDVFVVALARTSDAWCIVAQDNALVDPESAPPGWRPPVFLAQLRRRRNEAEGQRYPG